MIDASRRAAMGRTAVLSLSIVSATFAIASDAIAQAPTEAQRAAIRSECRSDYMAHCADVPPGGMEALQCLQKNMSSLSSNCQGAVRAVEAPAETKTEAKPEPAAAPKDEQKQEQKEEKTEETKTEPAP